MKKNKFKFKNCYVCEKSLGPLDYKRYENKAGTIIYLCKEHYNKLYVKKVKLLKR